MSLAIRNRCESMFRDLLRVTEPRGAAAHKLVAIGHAVQYGRVCVLVLQTFPNFNSSQVSENTVG